MSGEDDALIYDVEILTTSALLDLINEGTEDGTFLVGDKEIEIHGLDTAAYTPVETYTPMEVSIWTDLEGGI